MWVRWQIICFTSALSQRGHLFLSCLGLQLIWCLLLIHLSFSWLLTNISRHEAGSTKCHSTAWKYSVCCHVRAIFTSEMLKSSSFLHFCSSHDFLWSCSQFRTETLILLLRSQTSSFCSCSWIFELWGTTCGGGRCLAGLCKWASMFTEGVLRHTWGMRCVIG